ncbi:ABC transporter ATP-binding protein [Pseudarthrobacter sp. SSS035]|uniref:ABC transporter ATP-binding protein n=1 Tax=Pseudarthrobacter sp. SSS035 TaxID=2931399 RepID=UPI00200E42EF|nr:ABC transporter ATP-binding protein [Pseudarthrobacter sp. SSS035]
MSTLLEVTGITAGFDTPSGWQERLHDVSFAVNTREIVGIVGESGSGKSTAVRSVLGLLPVGGRVQRGSASFDGVDLISCGPKQLRKMRGRRIGFVAQNPFGALNPVLRLSAQFAAIFRAHSLPFGETERGRCIAMLAVTGIRDPERVIDGYAFELSGGMAQRVVIAMAMVLEPALVIADEPTTALDLTVQRQVLDVFAGLTMESGRSALIVTHDLGVVANYCDRVIVMLRGQIVECGDVADIVGDPQHPYTRKLLSSVRTGNPMGEVVGDVVR